MALEVEVLASGEARATTATEGTALDALNATKPAVDPQDTVTDTLSEEIEEEGAGAQGGTSLHLDEDDDGEADLIDVWTYMKKKRRGVEEGDEEEAKESDDDYADFTFPACDPVKRIDFVYLRRPPLAGTPSAGDAVLVEIVDARLGGTRPSEDTGACLCESTSARR